MPKRIEWEPIKRAYLVSGKSLEAIAAEFGVSLRSVETRSAEEQWAKCRDRLAPKKSEDKPRRPRRQSTGVDELEVVDAAIADLSADLTDSPIRSKESAATALVRLLEYREKLVPMTAADLAARAIELGISPEKFVEELREQWAAQQS